jgi:hypothetical protein
METPAHRRELQQLRRAGATRPRQRRHRAQPPRSGGGGGSHRHLVLTASTSTSTSTTVAVAVWRHRRDEREPRALELLRGDPRGERRSSPWHRRGARWPLPAHHDRAPSTRTADIAIDDPVDGVSARLLLLLLLSGSAPTRASSCPPLLATTAAAAAPLGHSRSPCAILGGGAQDGSFLHLVVEADHTPRPYRLRASARWRAGSSPRCRTIPVVVAVVMTPPAPTTPASSPRPWRRRRCFLLAFSPICGHLIGNDRAVKVPTGQHHGRLLVPPRLGCPPRACRAVTPWGTAPLGGGGGGALQQQQQAPARDRQMGRSLSAILMAHLPPHSLALPPPRPSFPAPSFPALLRWCREVLHPEAVAAAGVSRIPSPGSLARLMVLSHSSNRIRPVCPAAQFFNSHKRPTCNLEIWHEVVVLM